MNPQDYHSRPDGEYRTDTQETPIPPQDSWGSLSATQLVDVKIQLQTKLDTFRNHPQIVASIRRSLGILEGYIQRANSTT